MRKVLMLMITLILTQTSALDAFAEGTLQAVRQTNTLVAGVPDDEQPFGFRDRYSGELIGYDVDFVRAIATRLGANLRVKSVTEADRLAELMDGNVDLLAGGLVRSDARGAVVAFTDPYLFSGQKLIAPIGEIRRPEDLVGKKIGTVVGTFAETCVRGECLASVIVPFDDYIGGIQALMNGEIDAFTADEAILIDLFEGLPGGGYEIPDVFILEEEYVLGVRKGDPEFLDSVNRIIRAMFQDGEAERIRSKWFVPREEVALPAYGSIVRKAATRPRFLGVVLNGVLVPAAKVSVFALNGERLGTGTISSVVADEFYVDVAPEIYDLVQPGFLVAMNMNSEMALDVLLRRKGVLEAVKASSEQQAASVREQISREAAAKAERAIQMDTYREKLDESQRRDRVRYYRPRYYYRNRFRR